MNEDNPQDHSAPASNDAVPSTQAAEVAAQPATTAAADTTGSAPAAAAPASAAPVQGHEVPSTFTSHVPPAPQVAPVPHAFTAPSAPAPGTAPGAAFGLPTGASHTQPTQPYGAEALVGETKAKEQKTRGGTKFAALIVAAALVGGVAGFGGGALLNGLQDTPSSGTATGPQTVTVNNPGSVNETTAVATSALPSVVTIEVAGSQEAGSGSGVIISDDGYVLTNTHVVTLGGAAADPTIRVTASDGKIYEATVVGTDPIYDLAVIKLKDAKGLMPIDFADSSKLNVGDTTVALGAPLGLANSVTTGIVSALNRSIQIASSALPDSSTEDAPQEQSPEEQGQGPFQFDIPGSGQQQTSESISIAVIQTDAAINHGNSGGALVNSKGELIGINVAIASSGNSEESGSIGIGFAIPSNIAKRVSEEIIADGAATHGLLNASVQDASSIDGATVAGAYIAKANAGGAAAAAGIEAGDIVTSFNGVPITSATDLTAQVRAAAAGSDAKVTYVRDGKDYDVEVTLGELAG
ncbi:MAG: serine protease [Microbacterium sp.]|jgi:putative serine protease PepD|uniref:S1C family serine protease n=1 Tax=Microbacterium sp. TaxID=51671 RepID=UPI002633614C|nr:trypsin-like peptidase domain-containing protein [Microbacterium sp.]MDF2559731.1 serine protease [Microbacterium sp.]